MYCKTGWEAASEGGDSWAFCELPHPPAKHQRPLANLPDFTVIGWTLLLHNAAESLGKSCDKISSFRESVLQTTGNKRPKQNSTLRSGAVAPKDGF